MMLLALDTATKIMGLAIYDSKRLIAEQMWKANHNQTERLAHTIRDLLHHHHLRMADFTAVAVAVGPGSYAGVRIGVSMGKGLALAQSLPLIGMTTLDILAMSQPRYTGTLIALVDAGRERVITGTYRWAETRWVERGEARLLTWEEIFAQLDGPATLSGEISDEGYRALQVAKQANPLLKVSVAPASHQLRRTGFLAEMAWSTLEARGRQAFLATTLAPVYINSLT